MVEMEGLVHFKVGRVETIMEEKDIGKLLGRGGWMDRGVVG